MMTDASATIKLGLISMEANQIIIFIVVLLAPQEYVAAMN
jgi:hypothetical protein